MRDRSLKETRTTPGAPVPAQPLAKILPFVGKATPAPKFTVNQRRVWMMGNIIDNLIDAVCGPNPSEHLLRFIDRLVVEGATEDQIHRMTKQLNRSLPRPVEVISSRARPKHKALNSIPQKTG